MYITKLVGKFCVLVLTSYFEINELLLRKNSFNMQRVKWW